MRLTWLGLSLSIALGLLVPWEAGAKSVDHKTPERLVRDKAKAVFNLHRRARRALVQTARHPVFPRYFEAKSEQERWELKEQIERAALRTQSYFDVDEMCLIDRQGHEVARVDGGRISHDLAHDEADMVFFEPGFALPSGASLISPVYPSEDADSWVVAYVTPIYVEDRAMGLLHYEHPLDTLQKHIVEGIDAEKQFIVATNDEGWVVVDSRNPLDYKVTAGRNAPEQYFQREILPGWDVQAATARLDAGLTIDRYRGAYQKIGRWTLLVFEEAAPGERYPDIVAQTGWGGPSPSTQ